MELYVYEKGSALGYLIWPSASAGAAQPKIQEAHDYVFELCGANDSRFVDLYIDDVVAEALRPPDGHTARWRWSPGFYAGSVEIRLEFSGGVRESFTVITDPDLTKLTRNNFDDMVKDILEDTFALFNLSGFRTPIERGMRGPVPPIARLEFIRSRLEKIEGVVREIDRFPMRILRAEDRVSPYHRTRVASSPEIVRSFRSGRINRVAKPNCLPAVFGDLFPQNVRRNIRSVGLNIREHQDIKSSLRTWVAWLEVVAARLAIETSRDPSLQNAQRRWSLMCRKLAMRLRRLLELPLFADVSDAPSPVSLTSLYRNSPAYRAFFTLYQDMNLGIANITGEFLQMPLSRTFELYELWCFLRILRAIVNLFGLSSVELGSLFSCDATGGVTIGPKAVTVPFGQGHAICFQREYREYWLSNDRSGSFSRTMRPDVALAGDLLGSGNELLIILDAKYRVEERSLSEALASLHMYRDALVVGDEYDRTERIVIGAYILTPHIGEGSQSTWKGASLLGRLFHPGYRSTFNFGAATLRPGQSLVEVEDTLVALLRDSGVEAGPQRA